MGCCSILPLCVRGRSGDREYLPAQDGGDGGVPIAAGGVLFICRTDMMSGMCEFGLVPSTLTSCSGVTWWTTGLLIVLHSIAVFSWQHSRAHGFESTEMSLRDASSTQMQEAGWHSLIPRLRDSAGKLWAGRAGLYLTGARGWWMKVYLHVHIYIVDAI